MNNLNTEFPPRRLNLIQFAKDANSLAGEFDLKMLSRLCLEQSNSNTSALHPSTVSWSLQGQPDLPALEEGKLVVDPSVARKSMSKTSLAKLGLGLTAQTHMELTCQRCLSPVMCTLQVHRVFRFAWDEAAALALDDELEDDVLVLGPDFDAMALIEDELIMSLPLVPRHERCPVSLAQHFEPGEAFDKSPEKPNPFAVLAELKTKRG